MENRDVEKYFRDLETIRTLMTSYEEQPLVEHWVYGFWALVVAVGTFLTSLFVTSLTDMELVLRVWAPLIVIGATGEAVGFCRRMRKSGTGFLTRRSMKLVVSTIGLLLGGGILLVRAVAAGIGPGEIFAIGAFPLFIYAVGTYGELFYEAFLMIAAALILEIAGIRTRQVLLVTGYAIAITYAVAGLHSWWCERRYQILQRESRP